MSKVDELNSRIDECKMKLGAAKEQEAVLCFCLNTAEKHVAKMDQDTAARIAESRRVRLGKVRPSVRPSVRRLSFFACLSTNTTFCRRRRGLLVLRSFLFAHLDSPFPSRLRRS